jgi:hypothetical protein
MPTFYIDLRLIEGYKNERHRDPDIGANVEVADVSTMSERTAVVHI